MMCGWLTIMSKLVEFIYSIHTEKAGFDESVDDAFENLVSEIMTGESNGRLITRVTEQDSQVVIK